MRPPRLSTAVLLIVYLSACTRWMEQSQPVPQVVAEKRPDVMRLYLTNGREVELTQPQVAGDSLVGRELSSPAAARGDLRYSRAAYALSDIRRFETKEADTGKTWTVAGGIILILGVLILLAGESMESSW